MRTFLYLILCTIFGALLYFIGWKWWMLPGYSFFMAWVSFKFDPSPKRRIFGRAEKTFLLNLKKDTVFLLKLPLIFYVIGFVYFTFSEDGALDNAVMYVKHSYFVGKILLNIAGVLTLMHLFPNSGSSHYKHTDSDEGFREKPSRYEIAGMDVERAIEMAEQRGEID